MTSTLYKIVGWIYLFMCPFVGGNLLGIMVLNLLDLVTQDTGWYILIASSVVWVILFVTWFDGSDLQRDMI